MIDDIYDDDGLREKIIKRNSEIFHNSYDLIKLAKISFVYFLFIFLLVLFWNRRNTKYRFKV